MTGDCILYSKTHLFLFSLLGVLLVRSKAEHLLFLEIKHCASNDQDDQDNDDDSRDRSAANSLGLFDEKIE